MSAQNLRLDKVKTSILVDVDLYIEFKKYVLSKDQELNKVLKKLVKEKLMVNSENTIKESANKLINLLL